jgi:hypothetical protein
MADAGMSWQDWVQLVAVLVSAVAAVAAVWFAWRTVGQTRQLRRDDRRARLGELVGDYAATLLRVVHGSVHESRTVLPVAKARLAAALASAGESLPACDGLLARDGSSAPDVVEMQTALAVNELAGVDPIPTPGAAEAEVGTGVGTPRSMGASAVTGAQGGRKPKPLHGSANPHGCALCMSCSM